MQLPAHYLLCLTRSIDVVGRRRPILIVGSLGIAVMSIAFGLSQSLQQVVVTRFLGKFLKAPSNPTFYSDMHLGKAACSRAQSRCFIPSLEKLQTLAIKLSRSPYMGCFGHWVQS